MDMVSSRDVFAAVILVIAVSLIIGRILIGMYFHHKRQFVKQLHAEHLEADNYNGTKDNGQ